MSIRSCLLCKNANHPCECEHCESYENFSMSKEGQNLIDRITKENQTRTVILTLNESEIIDNPFVDFNDENKPGFYNFLSKRLFNSRENVTSIDVKKITVSQNIYDMWRERCSSKYFPHSDESTEDRLGLFNMTWLQYGPNIDETLPSSTVILNPGSFAVIEETSISRILGSN